MNSSALPTPRPAKLEAVDSSTRRRRLEGEIFNGATHLAGAVLAAAGLVFLVVRGVESRDPWKLGSFTVYGGMLLSLYVFSTLYHVVTGRAKRVFRKLDHLSIYLTIAGTYTPFAVVSLRGPWGFGLLAAVWTLAFVGIAQEFLLPRRIEWVSLSLYLGMGWLAVAVFFPMLRAIGPRGMALVAVGGLLYTAGVFFYVLDGRMRHSHGVFHLFVVGGSVAHFIAVIRYVA
jgi:hemolysin III